MAIAGQDLYFLDYGQYGPAPTYAQENAGVYCISGNSVNRVIPDATGWACAGTKIYTYNSPYGSSSTTYSVFDIANKSMSSFNPEGIDSPAAIGVDPVSGDVFIASYHLTTSDWGTYADYFSPGYVNIYDNNVNNMKNTFTCGVGPTRITFNVSSAFVEY